MSAEVIPFIGPYRRDENEVIVIDPPPQKGHVLVFFAKPPRPRVRKSRWLIIIEFCDGTDEIIEGPTDWVTAMVVARTWGRKYGFPVKDLSIISFD
jgi:hypothetical protein